MFKTIIEGADYIGRFDERRIEITIVDTTFNLHTSIRKKHYWSDLGTEIRNAYFGRGYGIVLNLSRYYAWQIRKRTPLMMENEKPIPIWQWEVRDPYQKCVRRRLREEFGDV